MAASPRILVLVVIAGAASGCHQPAQSAAENGEAANDRGSESGPVVVSQKSGPTEGDSAAVHCARQPFARALPIAEASGAVYVAAGDGNRAHLLVAGDSGTDGAILVVDADTGDVLWSGRLPLDDRASDDLEGLAVRGDTLYAITSSGWMRHFAVNPKGGMVLTEPAYAIAPPGNLVCASPRATNCAANYEGLCVRRGPIAPGACAGYAVSKAHGALYCLVLDTAGRLHVDGARRIEVAPARVLTGCEFAPDTGTLWVGSNLFGMSRVYVIDEADSLAAASVTTVDSLGRGFPEAIAVGPGGRVYRFSDVGKSPSLVDLYRCTPPP